METYKQEFIDFMVESDVLKIWRFYVEKVDVNPHFS